MGNSRIFVCNTDGSDAQTIYDHDFHTLPDGIQVYGDTLYWTCMGTHPAHDDGSLMSGRVALSASGALELVDVKTIVPPGVTYTPKQVQLDAKGGKLYWCDREGMRVMRSNLDGSAVETLVQTGSGAEDRKETNRWCVGIAVDTLRGLLYWTQKGASKGWDGRIFRAGIEIPAGETPSTRTDIQTLFAHLPEPIDLELDEETQTLYWTDRGDPPLGNTFNRAFVGSDSFATQGPAKSYILTNKFHEAIGLSLDLPNGRAFVTDLLGGVYAVDLDSGKKTVLIADAGTVTGCVYVPAV
ncbi:YWTD domain-containing protein [Exidia glandulosa HHB12029]|uniref:YWTD domain-containing protein n=1 Tax=Exidia glandulosa HHB12029 TaxID=1314781 RepID=A0A166AIQ6_EXIGL|nr:YWTD domain-containing protein [Exidia glandulosa HHB12029]